MTPLSAETRERIDSIAAAMFPESPERAARCKKALTQFAEEEQRERVDQQTELIMHQVFMDSLLDDLGAPKHPGNDTSRPKYGPYGRLRAYAESIGVKATMWEPLPDDPTS